MTDYSREAETKAKLNIAEEFWCNNDAESLDDYYPNNILQDELPFEENENDSKITDGQIAVKRDTRIDSEKIVEDMVSIHKTSELPSKKIVRFKSVSFKDFEDINRELTKIIPERHENKVDNGITDNVFTEININKPHEGKLIQEDKPVELISHDGYKTHEQPFEDMASNTAAVENLPSQIKDVEGLLLNNDKNDKKTFEETVNQFKQALEFPIGVKNKDISTLISKDKPDKRKSIDVDDNYYNTTQDQRDKEIESKVSSVVAFNAEVEVVLCSVDDKDTNYGKDSPDQEKMTAIDVIANIAELTNSLSESSDEEFTKKSKQFTFSDNDLPNSDEIRETLMSYPKHTVIESFSELEEVEDSSHEENYRFLRRRRNKIATAAMVDVMKLPERFITRHRNPVERLGISIEVSKTNAARLLKSRYLPEQEDDIGEEMIIENMKRLKAFERQAKSIPRKENNNKSIEHKETIEVTIKNGRKDVKSKSTSFGRKCVALDKNNTKKEAAKAPAHVKATRSSTLTAKTITRRTRSMKNDKENKVKPKSKKKTSTSPKIQVRRSKRQQTKKSSKSILRTHEQSTVYNISSSSSESSKSLKRSLVDDSDVPSPKRTRSHNTNNSSSTNNVSLRVTPARVMKTQHVLLTAFPSAEVKQDTRGPFVRLVRMRAAPATVQGTEQARNFLKATRKTRSETTRPRRPRR